MRPCAVARRCTPGWPIEVAAKGGRANERVESGRDVATELLRGTPQDCRRLPRAVAQGRGQPSQSR